MSGDFLAAAVVVLVLVVVLSIDAVVRARYGDRDAADKRIVRELRRHPVVEPDDYGPPSVVPRGARDE